MPPEHPETGQDDSVYVNLADLRTTAQAAELLGLKKAATVITYRRRFPDFPEPVIATEGGPHLYLVQDLLAWRDRHPRRPRLR